MQISASCAIESQKMCEISEIVAECEPLVVVHRPMTSVEGETDCTQNSSTISSISTSTLPSPPTPTHFSFVDTEVRVQIDRPLFDQEQFDDRFQHVPISINAHAHAHADGNENGVFQKCALFLHPRRFFVRNRKCSFSCKSVRRCGESFLPPLAWIPNYKLSWLLRDIIVGLTVSVLSIPQAMAYATLASVPPVVGLYSSFFPTLLYGLLGTSRHIMFGMFAVPSLMVGGVVEDLVPVPDNATAAQLTHQAEEAVAVCVTLTFCLGLIFTLMAVAQLHVLTAYLADNLVTGFTTAAAFHVLASQLPKLVAVKVPRHQGLFKLGKVMFDLCRGLPHLNLAATVTSAVCILILMLGKYLVNPIVTKKIKAPVPFELFIVVGSTLTSHFLHLRSAYGVSVVADIPTGIPAPKLPLFHRIPELLPRSLPIAIVIFGVTLSVAKLFAKKHGYKVNPAQDLRAMALIHLVVAFVRCHPCSGSLSRGAVASQLGGKSQLAGITASAVVLVVMLWLGPWLYELPKCVLASIIFVALQALFLQLRELPRLWKLSKIDFCIWLVSFVATVAWDVSEGLLVAVGFALFTIVLRTQLPHSISLGRIPGSELYRDNAKYRLTHASAHTLILRYDAPLLFVNASRFVSTVTRAVTRHFLHHSDATTEDGEKFGKVRQNAIRERFLVLDVSSVCQIDQMGVEALRELHVQMHHLHTRLLIASAKSPVRELFARCGLFADVPKTSFFPSIHDAVLFISTATTTSSDFPVSECDGKK